MGMTQDDTQPKSGLRESFAPALRVLTNAFVYAENNRAGHTAFDASAVMRAAREAGTRFDAMIGQNFVFGVEAANRLRILTSTASAAAGVINLKAEKQQKKRNEDAHFRRLLESLEAQFQHAREQREAAEKGLIEIYGEDFVVDLAAVYLDPETVKRGRDEGEAEYRQRLEEELSELMLLPDGTIKPQYRDLDIAKWLRWERREREVGLEMQDIPRNGIVGERGLVTIKTTIDSGDAHSDDQAAFGLLEAGVALESKALGIAGIGIKENDDDGARRETGTGITLDATFEIASRGLLGDGGDSDMTMEPDAPSLPLLDGMNPKA